MEACIPTVSRIFVDLKHVSKNIQKNLSKQKKFYNIYLHYQYFIKNISVVKKQYSCWHSFEQHIMRYFNSCIFNAGLRKKNNQDDAPTSGIYIVRSIV